MRKNSVILLTLLVILVSSCIKDDSDSCIPTSKVGISFNYLANGKTNLIQDYIESSKLYVYNRETEELIQSFQVKREMLQSTNTFSIKLSTGDYTVVAVGNASDRTSIKYVSNLHNARVASPEYQRNKDSSRTMHYILLVKT